MLPEEVKLQNLLDIFLDYEHRIEDGIERKRLAAFFIPDFETVQKSIIINILVDEVFNDYGTLAYFSDPDLVVEKEILLSKYEDFIQLCSIIDTSSIGYLS